MKIFVTGAAGYVGRHLLQSLHGKHEIVACDIVKPTEPLDGVDWVIIDKQLSVSDWQPHLSGCDVVIHLAQALNYRDFPDSAEELFDTNVNVTFKLFEAARKEQVKSFLLFSSGGIYGNEKESFHELDRLNPQSFYLATKGMSELIARKYREFMYVHIVRPFFIYGPGQHGKLLSGLIDRISQGKPVFINGDGDGGYINPIYINDIISLTEKMIHIKGNSTLNFAGPDSISIREIIESIGEEFNITPQIERKSDAEPLNMIADISRIRECFPDYKLTSFRDGLKFLKIH